MNNFPIAAAPQIAVSSRKPGQRLILLLILIWAVMFGLSSGGRVRASEPAAKPQGKESSAVALVTSGATFARPVRPAPDLQVSAWVDKSGPVTAPALNGKVQLVVFWGVNCPACVRKIPQVRQVARRFAETDLVIIGLHNAQISPERVTRFIRDQQLNYPVAIDRSGQNRYSFGMTSAAYQVQAIPHAAVIDRDGSLKYVGDFDEALKSAVQLLGAAG